MKSKKCHIWFIPFNCKNLFIDSSKIASLNKSNIDISGVDKRKTLKDKIKTSSEGVLKNTDIRFLNVLAKKFNIGDFLISPRDQKTLYFDILRIDSDYYFEENSEYPHQRKISSYKENVKKEDLPIDIYKVISVCLCAESIQRVDIAHDAFFKI